MCMYYICKYYDIDTFGCVLFKGRKCYLIDCIYKDRCDVCKHAKTCVYDVKKA